LLHDDDDDDVKYKGRRLIGKPGRSREVILKRLSKKYNWRVWIKLAQDRDRWTALENTVLNLQVP
jgi:hypothetical protein